MKQMETATLYPPGLILVYACFPAYPQRRSFPG